MDFSIDVRRMFGRCSIDVPSPISYLPFPISHCPFHISMSRFDRRLSISHGSWLGPAECAERLNPPPLPYGKSWRVESKPQVRNLRSHLADLRPPQNLPQRPRAFRPAASKCASDRFCDFQKTLAVAEREANKLCPMDLDANLHHKCNLQDPSFMIFMLQLTFRLTCFQKSASRCSGKHVSGKRLRAPSIKHITCSPPHRLR